MSFVRKYVEAAVREMLKAVLARVEQEKGYAIVDKEDYMDDGYVIHLKLRMDTEKGEVTHGYVIHRRSAKVKSMHRVDTFGNSPEVCRKLAESIGSLLGWRNSDDMMGSRWKFARRFTEGIRKLDGNAKGDCREEDQRTYRKITGGCRSMR
ncbi:hypothetical protein BHM03_00054668, partial [Ensete ventricosum]